MSSNVATFAKHPSTGPRGFTPHGREYNFFDGPERNTHSPAGMILSAWSIPDGFSVTIDGIELKLPEARRVLAAFTEVLGAVEKSAASWDGEVR